MKDDIEQTNQSESATKSLTNEEEENLAIIKVIEKILSYLRNLPFVDINRFIKYDQIASVNCFKFLDNKNLIRSFLYVQNWQCLTKKTASQ